MIAITIVSGSLIILVRAQAYVSSKFVPKTVIVRHRAVMRGVATADRRHRVVTCGELSTFLHRLFAVSSRLSVAIRCLTVQSYRCLTFELE